MSLDPSSEWRPASPTVVEGLPLDGAYDVVAFGDRLVVVGRSADQIGIAVTSDLATWEFTPLAQLPDGANGFESLLYVGADGVLDEPAPFESCLNLASGGLGTNSIGPSARLAVSADGGTMLVSAGAAAWVVGPEGARLVDPSVFCLPFGPDDTFGVVSGHPLVLADRFVLPGASTTFSTCCGRTPSYTTAGSDVITIGLDGAASRLADRGPFASGDLDVRLTAAATDGDGRLVAVGRETGGNDPATSAIYSSVDGQVYERQQPEAFAAPGIATFVLDVDWRDDRAVAVGYTHVPGSVGLPRLLDRWSVDPDGDQTAAVWMRDESEAWQSVAVDELRADSVIQGLSVVGDQLIGYGWASDGLSTIPTLWSTVDGETWTPIELVGEGPVTGATRWGDAAVAIGPGDRGGPADLWLSGDVLESWVG